MFDAPMGYHQLAVAPKSQEKLAFQGVDAIKWKYTVMPFGPTNGPATFINFIYDINSVWQKLATEKGVQINEDTNTKIIIDGIVSYAKQVQTVLVYMECQLIICQAYRLSLNLRKSSIFLPRFEFVGIDVCNDGNRPAQSSTRSYRLGHCRNLFGMWQSSLASHSSIPILSIISSSTLGHCAS
jgi:hypothetical protein